MSPNLIQCIYPTPRLRDAIFENSKISSSSGGVPAVQDERRTFAFFQAYLVLDFQLYNNDRLRIMMYLVMDIDSILNNFREKSGPGVRIA